MNVACPVLVDGPMDMEYGDPRASFNRIPIGREMQIRFSPVHMSAYQRNGGSKEQAVRPKDHGIRPSGSSGHLRTIVQSLGWKGFRNDRADLPHCQYTNRVEHDVVCTYIYIASVEQGRGDGRRKSHQSLNASISTTSLTASAVSRNGVSSCTLTLSSILTPMFRKCLGHRSSSGT